MNIDDLIKEVISWANDRNLVQESNANKQMLKVMEEIGELASSVAKKDQPGIIDGIGDSFVTLIILSAQFGYSPGQCLEAAYNEIKNRTGRTENGIFIKD